MLIKKSKKPIATFGFDINILSLKNRNPNNIKTNGKSNPAFPKYFSTSSDKIIKEGWLLVKDMKRIIPQSIRPKEKIE